MINIPGIKQAYQNIWDNMIIRPDWTSKIIAHAVIIENGMPAYREVCNQLNPRMPAYFVGIIHMMEADCSFKHHLHNGDPLTKRTTHVPAGRPIAPPKDPAHGYTWIESACDALKMKGFDAQQSWTLELMLFRFERYNGFGYARKGVLTPYLWSGTTYYRKGKFIADGVYDPNVVSEQVGAAPLLRYLTDKTLGIVR